MEFLSTRCIPKESLLSEYIIEYKSLTRHVFTNAIFLKLRALSKFL